MDTTTKKALVVLAVPVGEDADGIPQVAATYFLGPFTADPATFNPEQVLDVASTVGPQDPEAIGKVIASAVKTLRAKGVDVDDQVMVILGPPEGPADNPQPPREGYDPNWN